MSGTGGKKEKDPLDFDIKVTKWETGEPVENDEIDAGTFYCPYVPLMTGGEVIDAKWFVKNAVKAIEEEKEGRTQKRLGSSYRGTRYDPGQDE